PEPASQTSDDARIPGAFIVGPSGQAEDQRSGPDTPADESADERRLRERRQRTREKMRTLLREEKLEDRQVEVEVQQTPMLDNMVVPMGGMEGMAFNFTEMLQDLLPKRTKRRQVTIAEARRILLQDE